MMSSMTIWEVGIYAENDEKDENGENVRGSRSV